MIALLYAMPFWIDRAVTPRPKPEVARCEMRPLNVELSFQPPARFNPAA